MMVFQKKEKEPEVEPADETVAPPIPLVFIAKAGCERSYVLVHDKTEILADRTKHVTPGIRIVPQSIPGRKDVRIIRVTMQTCCNRPDNPFTPEAVSAIIMADKRYSGEAPTVFSYAEWQEEQAFVKAEEEEAKVRKTAFEEERARKYGKRGAA